MLFFVISCSNNSVSSDSDSNDLVGVWTGIEVNNESLNANFIFTSNQFTYNSYIDSNLLESMMGNYSLNIDSNHTEIDLQITSSFVDIDDIPNDSYAGLTALGIFMFRSDTLIFSGTEPGLEVRPLNFNQGQNDGYYSRVFHLTKEN